MSHAGPELGGGWSPGGMASSPLAAGMAASTSSSPTRQPRAARSVQFVDKQQGVHMDSQWGGSTGGGVDGAVPAQRMGRRAYGEGAAAGATYGGGAGAAYGAAAQAQAPAARRLWGKEG